MFSELLADLCKRQASKSKPSPVWCVVGVWRQAVYGAIRFCSMTPEQLEAIRSPQLSSLLLEACLRKFKRREWKTRVFPWTVCTDGRQARLPEEVDATRV